MACDYMHFLLVLVCYIIMAADLRWYDVIHYSL